MATLSTVSHNCRTAWLSYDRPGGGDRGDRAPPVDGWRCTLRSAHCPSISGVARGFYSTSSMPVLGPPHAQTIGPPSVLGYFRRIGAATGLHADWYPECAAARGAHPLEPAAKHRSEWRGRSPVLGRRSTSSAPRSIAAWRPRRTSMCATGPVIGGAPPGIRFAEQFGLYSRLRSRRRACVLRSLRCRLTESRVGVITASAHGERATGVTLS